MYLIKNKTATFDSGADLSNFPRYLPHETEPIDFYRKYIDDSFTPKNGESDSRNLFDDSDLKDHYWLSVARKYLLKVKL